MNERCKEVIKQLKMENKILYAENKKLKKPISYNSVDDEIEELWLEFRRLKHSRIEESERYKKKILIAYCLAMLSWSVNVLYFYSLIFY